MNLFTPERGANETQFDYRNRRAAAKAEVKRIRTGVERRTPMQVSTGVDGKNVEMGDPRGYFSGQHTNPQKNARRVLIAGCGGVRQFKKARRAARVS